MLACRLILDNGLLTQVDTCSGVPRWCSKLWLTGLAKVFTGDGLQMLQPVVQRDQQVQTIM